SDPSSSQPPRVGHARAVRHLLCRAQWREAARLARHAHLRNSALAGVQAALTTVVVLPLVLLSPWPHLVGPASLGALVALFARFAPPSERLPRLAVCLLLQLGAVFVTTLLSALGASDAVLLAWLAASCGLYLYLGMSLRVGPPGPLI